MFYNKTKIAPKDIRYCYLNYAENIFKKSKDMNELVNKFSSCQRFWGLLLLHFWRTRKFLSYYNSMKSLKTYEGQIDPQWGQPRKV